MKIITVIAIIFIGANTVIGAAGGCTYVDPDPSNPSSGTTIGEFLSGCKPEYSVDVVNGNAQVGGSGGFRSFLESFVGKILTLIGVLSIGSIAYSGALMTLGSASEDNINKGKKIFGWTLMGFFGSLAAGGVITIIVRLIFELGG